VESFHQNYVVIFQTTILRIVGFYVRRSANVQKVYFPLILRMKNQTVYLTTQNSQNIEIHVVGGNLAQQFPVRLHCANTLGERKKVVYDVKVLSLLYASSALLL
jgi:hypothetical protein